MVNILKQEALLHGDRLEILPVERLQDLKGEIDVFENSEKLNNFQKWIVNRLYNFTLPGGGFTVKSIILAAIPHPAYAKVQFAKNGVKYDLLSLVRSDFESNEKYLHEFITERGYNIKAAPNLPMKRLAVKCGLAVYGRNNITYVDGMGSYFSFTAYYTDLPCETDNWVRIQHAEICDKCKICFNNCPTGAIRKNRFLIDNEKCLSYLNENAGDFPEWLPVSVHHCVYDCLKCQIPCPMNRPYKDNVLESIKFNEDETDMLLNGVNFDEFPSEMKLKVKMLGMDEWIDAIPRNLKVLLDIDQLGHDL
ncbi:MAG: 4Fe-4S double cluster binding domain-containing protein [Bacillota bacterium]|nr:4Fe-4S double cluster binding domain-containing protein [Bacillota bacterium]